MYFDMMYVWMLYISWYVLGSATLTLTSLPIFAQQWERKHNDHDVQKNVTFKI